MTWKTTGRISNINTVFRFSSSQLFIVQVSLCHVLLGNIKVSESWLMTLRTAFLFSNGAHAYTSYLTKARDLVAHWFHLLKFNPTNVMFSASRHTSPLIFVRLKLLSVSSSAELWTTWSPGINRLQLKAFWEGLWCHCPDESWGVCFHDEDRRMNHAIEK